MILSIESSLSTFKTVRFQAGLNVLLADTQPGSTEKQTRNSAGKTSLLEIIHFLMGSNCNNDSLFRTTALIEHTFTGAFIIAGEQFTILRGGAEPSKIFLLAGGEDRADLPKRTDKSSGRLFVSNTNRRAFLGHTMFGMPADINGTAFEDPGDAEFFGPYSPTSCAVAIPEHFCIPNVKPNSDSAETGRSTSPTCWAWIGRSRSSFKRCADASGL